MEELNGYWEGYYIYGLGYDLPFFGEKVILFAELEFKNGIITGYHTEKKGPFSTGKTSTFNGYWEDDFVSFTAQHSSNPVILDDGVSTQELQHDFEITYNGSLNLQKKTINGLWYMENDLNPALELEIPIAEGLWMLKKMKKKPVTDFDYSLLG
ncbi:MAG: hypothetical protein ACSHWW_10055 [Nonlabens sp.]|uniref:hypothetical protein n=1 Tax=Nonlabens sp. TaxID=1888209 RepID=UPI003EF5152C